MTKEIIDYLTRAEMKTGKDEKNLQGMRSLHTDFKNNDQSQGYRVTFVDGLDDPNNAPEVVAQRAQEQTRQLRKQELENKPVSTIPEIRELLKLSL